MEEITAFIVFGLCLSMVYLTLLCFWLTWFKEGSQVLIGIYIKNKEGEDVLVDLHKDIITKTENFTVHTYNHGDFTFFDYLQNRIMRI